MAKDRMPGGWKIASSLLAFLVVLGLAWAGWLHARIDRTDTAVQLVQAHAAAEKGKTDVSITEIKGKLDAVEKNLERVEKGQDKIKEQLEQSTREQQKTNANIEQLLRQRGRTP